MIFSNWSKTPPDHPCCAIFRGLRVTRSGRIYELYEPAKIVYTWRGRQKELAAALCGRQQLIPLTCMDGEWQEAEL